ncbi:MAG: hypothetical protein ACK4ML_00870 [Alishewanella aestuarii]
MGLDIYFVKRSQNTPQVEEGDDTEIIHQWRKHNRLMDAMAHIYGEPIENCQDYPVTTDVLDQLEARINDPDIQLGDNVDGFFWGREYDYDDDMKQDDLEAVAKAREVIANGEYVFFHAWW